MTGVPFVRAFSRRSFIGGTAAGLVGLRVSLKAAEQEAPSSLEHLRPAGAVDEAYWRRVSAEIKFVEGMIYMNNGTLGPIPRTVFDARVRYARELAEDPRRTAAAYKDPQLETVRERVARFIGATPDEVALTRGTTEGMNIICYGLDLKEGDEVLMGSHEHPGGWHPYRLRERRHRIRVMTVEIPSPAASADQIVDLYKRAIGRRTRLIVVSHITYVTGLIMPIRELSEMAHRRRLLISVDGAHPPGMIPVDIAGLGCDFYASPGHKWLLAPDGTGFLYIKRELQPRVWPNIVGGAWDLDRGARRYEQYNERNLPETRAIADAIEFQETVGVPNIEKRIRQLSERFRSGLREIPGVRIHTSPDPSLSAGMTSFSVRDVPMENVVKVMMERNRIHIRTMTTGNLNAVRLSTHFYNTPEEVDLALEGIRHISENAAGYRAA